MTKTIKTKDLIKNLDDDDYLLTERLNNKKLNSISKEYILNNPICLIRVNNKYMIEDGRHRVFMAYLMGITVLPCVMEVVE